MAQVFKKAIGTSSGGYTVYLVGELTEISTDVATNTSQVARKVYAMTDKAYVYDNATIAYVDGWLLYNGYAKITTSGLMILNDTLTVNHNADGSGTYGISASLQLKNWGWYGETSGSITLSNIPRQAKLTGAPNFTDEENPTITYNNPAGEAVTSLKACIADANGQTLYAEYRDISKTGSSYTFNLTDEERNKLIYAAINSPNLTVKFYVTTVIGGNTYYSTLDKIMTITNAQPIIGPVIKDMGGTSVALTGDQNKIIKGFNYIQASVNATAQKGSSIRSQSITCGGQTINAASGNFENVESSSFVITATDSRGYTTTETIEKQLIDYVKLTCNLKANNPTADGKMSLKISGNYFNGNFGAVDNTLDVAFRYKENNGEYGEWIAASATISGNTYEATVNLTGLDYRNAYTFQARAVDKVNPIESAEKKVKSIPVYDWGEKDFAFNVDIIDKFNTLISNGLAEYEGGTIDVNETLSHLCLAQYNTPNNSLYYVMTFFYGNKTVNSNRTQIAIPYIYDISQEKRDIYVRQYVNGAWNEWKPANGENYSTSEQRIGTWIDGKPLYRKVIEGTTSPYTSVNLATIPNLETLVDIRGVTGGTYKGGMTWINLGVNPQQYRQVYVTGTTVGMVQHTNEATPYRIILEYTKTTD